MSAIRKGNIEFDVDAKISVLKSNRRRRLISLVSEKDQISITEASKIITAEDTGEDKDDIEYHDRHGVYTQLSQNHVPVLDQSNIVAEIDNVLFATEVTHDFAELIRWLDRYEIGGVRA